MLRNIAIASALLVLAIGLVFVAVTWKSTPTAAEFLVEVKGELRRANFEEAVRLCDAGLQEYEGDIELLRVAAEASIGLKNPSKAAEYLGRVALLGDDPRALSLLLLRADILRKDGRFHDALRQLQQVRSADPRNTTIREHITGIYVTTGYREDAITGMVEAMSEGPLSIRDLHILAKRGSLALPRKEMLQYLEQHPSDVMLMHAVATTAVLYDDHLQRRNMLEKAYSTDRRASIPRMELAEILLDDSSPGALKLCREIINSLSKTDDKYALAWLLKARYLVRVEKTDLACRCLGEAIKRDPRRTEGYFMLAGLLRQKGLDASPLDKAAALIKELDKAADIVNQNPRDETPFHGLVGLLIALERKQEALQWCSHASKLFPGRKWPQELTMQLQGTKKKSDNFGLTSLLQNDKFDFRSFPLPTAEDFQSTSGPDSSQLSSLFSLIDETETIGINFKYQSGADDTTGPMLIQQSTGGGIGAVDLDADGWADLYFSQGSIMGHSNPQLLDQIYRNIRGQRFSDVTQLTGIVETRYGQGVAIGDLNNDGFDDIYVANAGQNTALMNSGDGTFEETSLNQGVEAWTASAAIADLNGDSLPDIYDVNYAGGNDVYTRVCHENERQHLCGPNVFPPEPDRVWLNQGAGSFVESSRDLGMAEISGRGLGIVVADMNADGQNDIYVANDTTPNFLYQRQSGGKYADNGLSVGVALDSEGRSMGSMGIAFGDVDENGLSDIFVTNYFMEMNNLYLQSEFQTYRDDAPGTVLGTSSTEKVGFGTQFVDFDHDGDLDLIVVNGHVADFSFRTTPYRMPAQLYRNEGTGQFVQQATGETDGYLNEAVLGRAVTKLDWNRDGLEDLAISHLDHSAVVLTNRTVTSGKGFRMRCIGTSSSRDAVGTIVKAFRGSRCLIRQVTAGDGYMASNEKRLDFGTGTEATSTGIEIQWPSGSNDKTELPTSVDTFSMVEGRTAIYVLPM